MKKILIPMLAGTFLFSFHAPAFASAGENNVRSEMTKKPQEEKKTEPEDEDTSDFIFNVEVSVLDAATQQPIEGAEVRLLRIDLKKTDNKALTDAEGKARLEEVVLQYYISVKYKGYRTKVLKLDEKTDKVVLTLNKK